MRTETKPNILEIKEWKPALIEQTMESTATTEHNCTLSQAEMCVCGKQHVPERDRDSEGERDGNGGKLNVLENDNRFLLHIAISSCLVYSCSLVVTSALEETQGMSISANNTATLSCCSFLSVKQKFANFMTPPCSFVYPPVISLWSMTWPNQLGNEGNIQARHSPSRSLTAVTTNSLQLSLVFYVSLSKWYFDEEAPSGLFKLFVFCFQ